MAQTESLVDQGVDRVQDVLKNADKEFQRLQRRVRTRRRTIERRIQTQRKSFEKNFEKQAKSIEKQAQKQMKQIRKNDLVKRAETLGKDVQAQVESGLASVLSMFQIASKADIKRVDRKLNRISRKLKELEAPTQA
jgi:DNA replication initiation complex subunit (GINS family)